MKVNRLDHVFVDTVPDTLDPGILYISIEFRTTMHLCCCGCGNPVVLPLRRAAWSLTYDGETITLSPSVANWSFPCRSHYVIRASHVVWADDWSLERVEAGRQATLAERRRTGPPGPSSPDTPNPPRGWVHRVLLRAARWHQSKR
jgi:hypothetical protein